jgi:hypothetical protein
VGRRFFFFPHRVERADPPLRLTRGEPPWRVPYEVRAAMVSPTGVQTADGVVMGDGYQVRGGGAIVGGNQDPCVFSDPLGGLHAFCRIVRRKGRDHDVVTLTSATGLLPTVVAPGDVVFYGKPDISNEVVAVDTVFVVQVTAPFQDAVKRVGAHADAYAFNLSDARPGGSHAGEDAQRVIIGRSEATVAALDALGTSFVPLAERDANGRWRVLRVGREDIGASYDDLRRVFSERMFGVPGPMANKGYICELPPAAGEALARAVIARSRNQTSSGAVVVPPLQMRGRAPLRFGGDGDLRHQEDHLGRLA